MEYLILVFLLFIAVLAFGWFYLQRAKVRDAGPHVSHVSASANESTDQQGSEAPHS